MNKPIELFLWLWGITDGGVSFVTEDDIPGVLLNVYGVSGEPDESAMLAANYDINGLVALGWIRKHVRDGVVAFVITDRGARNHARIQDVSATADTPSGPVA